MKTNMGIIDRAIRVAIAVILGTLYFNGNISGTLGIVALVIAAVFLLTSIVGFCPLYVLFRFSSKKEES